MDYISVLSNIDARLYSIYVCGDDVRRMFEARTMLKQLADDLSHHNDFQGAADHELQDG